MDKIILFIDENLSYKLLFIILLGGIYITKYSPKSIIISDTYKVLFASIIFSTIFYFIDGCGWNCITKYLFTYLFATSFYDLLVKRLINKLKNLNKE